MEDSLIKAVTDDDKERITMVVEGEKWSKSKKEEARER